MAAWPEEAFEAVGGIDRATYVAVLTHDPKLDDAALTHRAALRRRLRGRHGQQPGPGQAPRAAAGRRAWTRCCWSGWPRPSGSTSAPSGPEETALSIMAEVVAVRNGRSGGRLRDKQGGRIHEITGEHA